MNIILGHLLAFRLLFSIIAVKYNDDVNYPDGSVSGFTLIYGGNLSQTLSRYGSDIQEWADYWTPILGNKQIIPMSIC